MIRNSFTRAATALTLGLAALTSPMAQAALVNVDFTVTTDTPVGSFGDTFNGHFSYDDAALRPGAGFGGEDLYDLLSFSFTFAGQSYALADVPGAALAFDPATGEQLGLDAVEAAGSAFAFVPGLAGAFPGFFSYDLGQDGSGLGRVSYEVDTGTVPEPATLGLLAFALAAAGAARRRAAR